MPKLYLVRHGEAAAGWNEDPDPSLSALGRQQARELAAILDAAPPKAIITSPLLRCRETAAVLERLWNTRAIVNPAIAEVPSPLADLDARGRWLKQVFQQNWDDVDAATRRWRDHVVSTLLALPYDTVLFTHFVAINAAVGNAIGDVRVLCCHPDNCSITSLNSNRSALTLCALGAQADTKVN